MHARTLSAQIVGFDAITLRIKAEVSHGLPGLAIDAGAADTAEVKVRVRSALAHCGHVLEPRKQTVRLDLDGRRYDAQGLDLAVAVALLVAHGVVPQDALEGLLLWGELALDGSVRPTIGTLMVAERAIRSGCTRLAVAESVADEAALANALGQGDAMDVLPIRTLAQLVAHLRGEAVVEPRRESRAVPTSFPEMPLEVGDIAGMEIPKRALEIAVAGRHGLLLYGPHGCGKTALARRAAGLVPELDVDEAFEVTKIHGLAHRRLMGGLVRTAPMRLPHHTVSILGLHGGGSPARPGEVTLAHRGILLLDEAPEFASAALEVVEHVSATGVAEYYRPGREPVIYPAAFTLIATMTECPCGRVSACMCSVAAIERYQRRLTRLARRLDLAVPCFAGQATEPRGPSAAEVRERIREARQWLATMPASPTESRTARVARTIAALDPNADPVAPPQPEHIEEAAALWAPPSYLAAALEQRIPQIG